MAKLFVLRKSMYITLFCFRYNKCLATGMRREAVQDERNRGSGGGAGGGANNSGGGGGQVSQSLDIKFLMVQFKFV